MKTAVAGRDLIPESGSRPCSPDVFVGAYLVSHLQPRCENCNTPETPQWRKGWHSEILGRNVILCNACGLKYNKNQYCPYCYYVYYKEEDKKDIDSWVACDECQRWVHIECEMKCGGRKNFNPFESYRCPSCRARPPKISKHAAATGGAMSRHQRRSESPPLGSAMDGAGRVSPTIAESPAAASASASDVDAMDTDADPRGRLHPLHPAGPAITAHNDEPTPLPGWRYDAVPLAPSASL